MAQQTSRVPGVDAWLTNIVRHYRSRPNHDVVTDANWQQRGVTANRYVISDARCFPEVTVSASRTPGCVTVVDEHDTMGDRTVVSNGHLFTDKGVGLNACTRAYVDTALDLYKGADKDIVSHSAIVQVNRFDNRHAVAELYVSCCNGFDVGVHRIFE